MIGSRHSSEDERRQQETIAYNTITTIGAIKLTFANVHSQS